MQIIPTIAFNLCPWLLMVVGWFSLVADENHIIITINYWPRVNFPRQLQWAVTLDRVRLCRSSSWWTDYIHIYALLCCHFFHYILQQFLQLQQKKEWKDIQTRCCELTQSHTTTTLCMSCCEFIICLEIKY